MDMSKFIVIGENIHCTRIVMKGGKNTVELAGGGCGVAFESDGQPRVLRIPDNWAEQSPPYADGKIRHVALAIYQALHGKGDNPRDGEDYLVWIAQKQIDAGTTFLDVNADEFSNDPVERTEVMSWLAGFLSQRFDVPLSIDSSSIEILAVGLDACRAEAGSPMVNSISLERPGSLDLITQYNAHAIANAAGRNSLPTDLAERMTNLEEIIGMLDKAGVPLDKMHLDLLVFPVSTDQAHGPAFLEAVREVRKTYPPVHITGGFSNVSFGMPQRSLLSKVFIYLCAEAGADSGIINPVAMSAQSIGDMDTESEPFKLAKAFLLGEDMYGMEFISAHREGKFG